MLDPKKVAAEITTPTVEEQEAVIGGALVRSVRPTGHAGFTVDPELLHEPTKPKWDPGGPPQRAF